MTVYADILFLINFSMDFLSLCLAGRLTGERMSRTRLVSAAGLGSLIGTGTMFVLSGFPFVLCGFCTAVLMTRTAFGKQRMSRLLRGSVILWGTGTLLGGVMTSVLSLGEAVYFETGKRPAFLPVFLLCFGISSLLTRLTGNVSGRKSAEVVLTAGGVTVTFDALCDSGCLLTEPLSGMPVIVAGTEALGALVPLLCGETPVLRLRMIPADGVCGHRLLRGFVPDEVSVNGRKTSAVIAHGEDLGNCGGFAGIVPAKLAR